jgi:hypothetical protein
VIFLKNIYDVTELIFAFYYRPIILILLTNIGMFVYAAYIFRRLQRNTTKSRGYQRKISSSEEVSTSPTNKQSLHKQFSRQLSRGETTMSKNLQKQKANIERFIFLKYLTYRASRQYLCIVGNRKIYCLTTNL